MNDPAASAPLRLAALLAMRLCHDLSGAVGTVAAALDLAAEDPASAAEATELATEAARLLAARLRLLRAAWGDAGSPLTVADIAGLASGLARPDIAVSVDGLAGAEPFGPEAGRMLLNLLLLAAESLPRGGSVSFADDTRGGVAVTLRGHRAAWPAELAALLSDAQRAWAALAECTPAHTAARLQGPLTALIAQESGFRLTLPTDADDTPFLLLTRES